MIVEYTGDVIHFLWCNRLVGSLIYFVTCEADGGLQTYPYWPGGWQQDHSNVHRPSDYRPNDKQTDGQNLPNMLSPYYHKNMQAKTATMYIKANHG